MTAVVAALVGLFGSVYNEQIVAAFPLSLPDPPWTVSAQAIAFWLALFTLAACVYLRQLVDDEARGKLDDTTDRIQELVQTLPPRAFQAELARAVVKVHAVTTEALPRTDTTGPTAESLGRVIRSLLHSIASLALIYDDKPLVSGRPARYAANVMLFVPINPEQSPGPVEFLAGDDEWKNLRGVLCIRRELSASSDTSDDPSPDPGTPTIKLPVPKTAMRNSRSAALPGAPYAFANTTTAGYQNTTTLLEWCREKGDFAPSVVDKVKDYFATGAGKDIRSFVSTPLADECGVLNIHADRTDLLGPQLVRREIFHALITPLLLTLGDLVAAFIDAEGRELKHLPHAGNMDKKV